MDHPDKTLNNNYDEVQKTIAENLRRIWHMRGYSQEKLSFLSDIDRSYIGYIENCKYNVSVKVLCDLPNALEVEVQDLIAPSQEPK